MHGTTDAAPKERLAGILFAHGSSHFASKVSQLAGNHFLETVEGEEQLEEMWRHVRYNGAQELVA